MDIRHAIQAAHAPMMAEVEGEGEEVSLGRDTNTPLGQTL